MPAERRDERKKRSWAYSTLASEKRKQKVGTPEEWRDLYRLAFDTIEPYREGLDRNLSNAIKGAERFLEEAK